MKQRHIEVEQVDTHIRLKSGQILLSSENYFDEATARRAAKQLVHAINTRPMRLTLWLRGNPVTKLVRKVWSVGADEVAALPVDSKFFDATLESWGT